jgi:hypothetical protein
LVNLPIQPGQLLIGSLFGEPMRVETVASNGPESWIVGLVGLQSERFRKVTLTAKDLASLTIQDTTKSYDGDGRLLRLGLQAYALGIASNGPESWDVGLAGLQSERFRDLYPGPRVKARDQS